MHRKNISEISSTQLKRRIGIYPKLKSTTAIPKGGVEERVVRDLHDEASRYAGEVSIEMREEFMQEITPANESSSGGAGRDSDENCISFRQDLAQWSIKHNITATALTSLLHLLREHRVGVELPLDGRTLLETPKATNATQMLPGKYFHFGLKSGLRNILIK